MKNKIFTSLRLIAVVLFSSVGVHSDSLLFTQAKAQTSCVANWGSTVSMCMVTFTNTSTGTNNNTYYYWNFGDGKYSYVQNPPAHSYSVTGSYQICLGLSSNDSTCSSQLCKWLTVQCGGTNGIADLIDEQSMSIYPNPTNGKFTLVIASKAKQSQIEVYNVLGEKVYSITNSPINQSTIFDISSQPSGVYFLNIKTDKESFTQKLIIQK